VEEVDAEVMELEPDVGALFVEDADVLAHGEGVEGLFGDVSDVVSPGVAMMVVC
jgi:hypothetical protein